MISVENLVKTFPSRSGNVVALDGVSLEVPQGTVCGVVGQSGAGKSTLARCIALLEKPDSGAIRVDGTDLVRLNGADLRSARRQIALVEQEDILFEVRTVAGNVALPLEVARTARLERRARVLDLLDLVGLADKAAAYPDQLSRGERQRVAIARALVARPSVLVADDPTSALDKQTTAMVLGVLDRVRAELGVTVLIVTHDMEVLRRVCDRAAVLEHGRIIEHGSVLDLVTQTESRVAAMLLPEVSAVTEPGVGSGEASGSYDRVVDLILVGFAAVGALLPEATSRFRVNLALLGGGLTRLGETPVARFRIGLTGEHTNVTLDFISQHGGLVQPISRRH
ncbi:methionine import ATP-binding protein MetN [Longimycelium tulufanense]|uniref:Methionine import ATP-binding protein MetN n=1 Tax=Longimycelium tulufanense TaxID=907463 RepID=A0A8J3FV13_9PSEU|nr:ATP-binding cassette domain-containing protein [Longimycelium tulufanense]GGM59763.1 methionine import ATP-binding protein MetN [Longimycelium tulufanense]